MSGKNTQRSTGERAVTMHIDGKPVELNGFVQDVFQEVIVGLVRSLGHNDETGALEIRIASADDDKGAAGK